MTKKDYCHLTLDQRYKIEALLKAEHEAPFIAKQLNVNKSTIYRELKRNRTKTGCYSARLTHERIYQFIYQDKAEEGQLYKHLRVASSVSLLRISI